MKRNSSPWRRLVAAIVVVGSVAVPSAAFAAIDANSADDVCAPGDNPCIVSTIVRIANGSVLDFGVRGLHVAAGGQLDFGTGSASVLCGDFQATSAIPAIHARGPAGDNSYESGTASLTARRQCSGGATTRLCMGETDCELGACAARRCTKDNLRSCTTDGNCQLGVCGPSRRCTDSFSFARCSSNADCDKGSCPQQLVCSALSADRVECGSNTDCSFGNCSLGTGSITMNSQIAGYSSDPATVNLRAAGDVTLLKLVNLLATAEPGGGDLSIDSSGSVTVAGEIDAGEGDLAITADQDILLQQEVRLIGDEYGGSADLRAGRDIVIQRSVLAQSTTGDGQGGYIDIAAGRDLSVTSSSALFKTRIDLRGHDAEYGGSGGELFVTVGRHLLFGLDTVLDADAAGYYGLGGSLDFISGGDATLNGSIQMSASGTSGQAGFINGVVGGAFRTGSEARFDLIGGGEDGGGGFLWVEADGDIDFAGRTDLRAGTIELDSWANLTLSGTISVKDPAGEPSTGYISLAGCRVTLTGTGVIDRDTDGDSYITAYESMRLLAGSKMLAQGPPNYLFYRSADKPPLLEGEIDPPPDLDVDPSLTGCPVCGNDEIDDTETCDDGNTAGGDGCSADCQNEICISQTAAPGWPSVHLCDDGAGCTVDSCNVDLGGGTCEHVDGDCNDYIPCTTDSCGGDECVHVANDGACGDGNPCTDDSCSGETGCTNTPNAIACDDGNACTENDHCSDGECAGEHFCAICGDGTITGDEQCDDGTPLYATGDWCSALCELVSCGQPTSFPAAEPKASDALFALKAAVQQVSCSLLVCDVDGSGKVLASDSLRILRLAVGFPIVLACPDSL